MNIGLLLNDSRRVRMPPLPLPKKLAPYLFVAPAMIAITVFIIYPLIYSFWLSFHDYQFNMPSLGMPFVGFQNYQDIPQNADLLQSVGFTVTFAAFAVPIEFALGAVLALILNSRLTGKVRGVLRGLFLIPMMLSGTVAGYIWGMLLDKDYGPVNHLLSIMGIQPIAWFSNALAARAAVIAVDVWLATPFMMLILLAGLQSVPVEYYEAARIDGANSFELLWNITVPLLKYPIVVALLIRTMDALRAFDIIYLLTHGGPGTSTTTVMYYNYQYAFNYYQMGRASAVSIVVLIVIAALTGIYLQLIRQSGENER